MSGSAIEIYLKTIATGDGAKKTAADYVALQKVAAKASAELAQVAKAAAKEAETAAKQAARAQEVAAKQAATATAKAAREQAAESKKAANDAAAAVRQAVREQALETKRLADAESKATSGRARGLLELSRIAQDAQYGIAGVINNVEGLTTALGAGAGLTGIIAGLAVGVQVAGPKIVEWLGNIDTATARLRDNVATLERASAAVGGGYSSNAENAAEIERARQDKLRQEKEHFEDINKALERRLELLNAIREAEATAEQRAAASKAADIAAQGLPDQQQAMEEDRAKREQLAAQYARDRQAAQDTANTVVEQLNNKSREIDSAEAREAVLKKEQAIARREKFLLDEQAKLEKAVAATRASFNMPMSPQLREEADRKIAEAQAKADANRALLDENKKAAPDGRPRNYDQVTQELTEAQLQLAGLIRQFNEAAAAERARLRMAGVEAGTRDNNYRRDLEELDRAAQLRLQEMIKNLPMGLPGANPSNFLPQFPEPAGNGVMDPRNYRVPYDGLPQVPGAPASQLPVSVPPVDTKLMEDAAKRAAEETQKGVETVAALLGQIGQAWAAMERQVATMSSQMRNSNRTA